MKICTSPVTQYLFHQSGYLTCSPKASADARSPIFIEIYRYAVYLEEFWAPSAIITITITHRRDILKIGKDTDIQLS